MKDWTIKNGRSNSSDEYLRAVRKVQSLLGCITLTSNLDLVARNIVSTLAHEHGWAPADLVESESLKLVLCPGCTAEITQGSTIAFGCVMCCARAYKAEAKKNS